jgi:predicted aconitase with swiveling domain
VEYVSVSIPGPSEGYYCGNGICGILLVRLKSKGSTVAQELKIKDADGNTFIPDIVVVSEKTTIIIYPNIARP